MSKRLLPRQLLAEALGCQPEDLTNNARMYDTPGWDSLGHAAVVSALESNYRLTIESPFAEDYISLPAIERLYQSLQNIDRSLPSPPLRSITVITRDRHWTLRRCLESIISEALLPQHLLVLDESIGEELAANERIMSYLQKRLENRCAISHIAMNDLIESLTVLLPPNACSWLTKPSSRDISVNRTLTLVFSLLVDPNSTDV